MTLCPGVVQFLARQLGQRSPVGEAYHLAAFAFHAIPVARPLERIREQEPDVG